MTYLKELPICKVRFGRTDIIENNEKKIARLMLVCGYREVDPEECIICGGFKDIKLEFQVDTFIRVIKGKWFKLKGNDKQDYHEDDKK